MTKSTEVDPRIADAAYAALEAGSMVRDRDLLQLIDLSAVTVKNGHPVVPAGFVAGIRATKPSFFAWPPGSSIDFMRAPRHVVDTETARLNANTAPWLWSTPKIDPSVDAMKLSREDYAAACDKLGMRSAALR